MSITYNDLISRAEQVRDESEIGANTATRVGQLLADIIQWCQDNNADLGDYLLNFTAHLNESGGILNWFQSRIVLLKTMGSAYDDVSVGSLSDGDVYYDSQGNWIREKSGSATINGIHPSKGVFYVNLANQTAYQWDGTTFQVAIESGSGGGASTVTAFEGYEVIESVAELPEQGDPVTGYIVGTHIYAYVGENGDTADGAYQDLGDLGVDPDIYQPRLTAGSGISINSSDQISVDAEVVQPATPDGTFTIRIGTNTYTINLNHTHEDMAKVVVVSDEADLPATLDEDTIYGVEEDSEISVVYIGGYPFYGGGSANTPVLRQPTDGVSINIDELTSGALTIKGKNLTQALTVAVTGNFTVNGSASATVTAADANAGTTVTLACTTQTENESGTLSITNGEGITTDCTLVANVPVIEEITSVKLTGTQWLMTDYFPNANTEFELECRFEENSQTGTLAPGTQYPGEYIFHASRDSNNKGWVVYHGSLPSGLYHFNLINEDSLGDQILLLDDDHANFLTDHAKLKYVKQTSKGVFSFTGTSTVSVDTVLKTTTTGSAMSIGYNQGLSLIYDQFDLTIYELKITENGTLVRDYVPRLYNGVPGLYDTVNNTFISSQTATALEYVE